MKKSLLVTLALLSILLLLLTGCTTGQEAQASIPGDEVYKTGLDHDSAGSEILFTIPVESESKTLFITAQGVTEGQVSFQLLDPGGAVLWDPGMFGGEWSFDMFPELTGTGEYTLQASWDGPLSGEYLIGWKFQGESPLTPLILVSGIGMVLAGLAFVTYAAVKHLGGKYLLLGAAAWMVSVALKFAFALPFNQPIYNWLYTTFTDKIAGPIFWVYVGLLTGVFEVALVYLFLRRTRFGRASWKQALAFGIGFGSVEAILLGILNLLTTISALLIPDQVGATLLNSLAAQNNLVVSLAPVSERIFTILVHIFCNAAIFYAINARIPAWLWLSVAFKTALDGVAAYAQTNWVDTPAFLWTIEGIIILFGLVALYGTWQISKKYPLVEDTLPPASSSSETTVTPVQD